jgi:hypothetical protein
MNKVLLIMVFFMSGYLLHGQSKSITRFREDHKENTNMFFYKSTLKMLNTENNPEINDLLKDIEEIRVLNYDKAKQHLTREDIASLKQTIRTEDYNSLMMINEKNNTIDLFSHEKRGKTVGFIAVVENKESMILIDLAGSIDVRKFLELKQKLDSKMENSPE